MIGTSVNADGVRQTPRRSAPPIFSPPTASLRNRTPNRPFDTIKTPIGKPKADHDCKLTSKSYNPETSCQRRPTAGHQPSGPTGNGQLKSPAKHLPAVAPPDQSTTRSKHHPIKAPPDGPRQCGHDRFPTRPPFPPTSLKLTPETSLLPCRGSQPYIESISLWDRCTDSMTRRVIFPRRACFYYEN